MKVLIKSNNLYLYKYRSIFDLSFLLIDLVATKITIASRLPVHNSNPDLGLKTIEDDQRAFQPTATWLGHFKKLLPLDPILLALRV